MPKRGHSSFQRARQPAQIEQRREAILQGALTLFQRNGLENVSLNDIAREVALAKSNIYRYFDSREHVYLVVLQRLATKFEQRIYDELDLIKGKKSVTKVADALIAAYLVSPEYGELITVVNSVLERRLTPELVINFRAAFLERRQRLSTVLAVALGTTPEKTLRASLHIFLHVPGLWTFCFPREESKAVLQEPRHRHLLVDFRTEMSLFLRAILNEAKG
jgi:TetR/AcrR family transcriptional regulator